MEETQTRRKVSSVMLEIEHDDTGHPPTVFVIPKAAHKQPAQVVSIQVEGGDVHKVTSGSVVTYDDIADSR